MIKKRILCDHCRGTGAASDSDIHQCPGCGGSGVKVQRQQLWPGMVAQSQVTYVLSLDCPGWNYTGFLIDATNAVDVGKLLLRNALTVADRK